MRSRRLFVTNQSTLVSHDEVYEMAQAVNAQVREHVAPAWGMNRVVVEVHTGPLETVQSLVPKGSWVIAIVDKPDQPGVLGWHWTDDEDRVFGYVFAEPCFAAGSTAVQGTYSVSAVLSHEVLETFIDPFCGGWEDSGRGFLVARELCDPVEADVYQLGGIDVSNFVLPEYFNPITSGGEHYDYLQKLTQPFAMTPGGYWVQAPAAHSEQKFGEVVGWEKEVGFDLRDGTTLCFSEEMPEWRRELKLASGRNRIKRSLV